MQFIGIIYVFQYVCCVLLCLEGFEWYPDYRKPSTQPQEPLHGLSCSLVKKPPNMRQTIQTYSTYMFTYILSTPIPVQSKFSNSLMVIQGHVYSSKLMHKHQGPGKF